MDNVPSHDETHDEEAEILACAQRLLTLHVEDTSRMEAAEGLLMFHATAGPALTQMAEEQDEVTRVDSVEGGADGEEKAAAEEAQVAAEAEAAEEADDEDNEAEIDESGALLPPHKGWKVGQPMDQPLRFHIPTDGQGNTEIIEFEHEVDFDIYRSEQGAKIKGVYDANHYRQQRLLRKNDMFGLPKRRRRTAPKITDEQKDWLADRLDSYANATGGERIPDQQLADEFNARFPDQGRSVTGVAQVITRDDQLKEKKLSYRPVK